MVVVDDLGLFTIKLKTNFPAFTLDSSQKLLGLAYFIGKQNYIICEIEVTDGFSKIPACLFCSVKPSSSSLPLIALDKA